MQVRFWGTRGSIATPGASTVRYGGNTSCIEVSSDAGDVILIDCGTGAHALGKLLHAQGRGKTGHILISHTHWDHIQGLPFFGPLFVPGNEWHVYGPRGLGHSLKDILAGQMEYAYFPVALNAFAANMHFHEVVEGAFAIGDIRVITHYLNHPALTVGYRIEADGASVVYASDHEPHGADAACGAAGALDGRDAAHVDFLREADLVIHDAQYTAAEYPEKAGWGHSTIEYAVDAAVSARAKRLALFHHDPARTDEEVDILLERARARAASVSNELEVLAATEGQTIQLEGAAAARTQPFKPSSLVAPASEASEGFIFIVGAPAPERAILAAAAEADGVAHCADPAPQTLREAVQGGQALLIYLGSAAAGGDPLALCRELRAAAGEAAKEVPIIVVTEQSKVDTDAGADAGITDWLTWPYSVQYARSRQRAWLMRSMLRWRKAALPANEERRLAAVHKLGLLDTEPEERFDRHARIAAAALNAPIALVTLVDRDRQWFKSHQGFDFSETPRDIGFCSHAVLADQPLVVNDALTDDRFAENPAVVGDPHVRFYAGIPLHAGGSCVGAFCIVDHKPRDLSSAQLAMLKDIARLVEEELSAEPAKD